MSAHAQHGPTGPIIGTIFSAVSAAGMSDAFRETVHAIAGFTADVVGFLVSSLTLCYWVLMLYDKARARREKPPKTG